MKTAQLSPIKTSGFPEAKYALKKESLVSDITACTQLSRLTTAGDDINSPLKNLPVVSPDEIHQETSIRPFNEPVAITTEDTLRIVDTRILDGWSAEVTGKQRTGEEQQALAQFYEDNFIPLWRQKSNESKLLDTWVSAILAMDDTGKPKKDVKSGHEGKQAPSCGSEISLNKQACSLEKLISISGRSKASKQRRKARKSPQSASGVRTIRGLEFLNRLQNKPRRHGYKKHAASGIFLPENFPFGLTPVPIYTVATKANFFQTEESFHSGAADCRQPMAHDDEKKIRSDIYPGAVQKFLTTTRMSLRLDRVDTLGIQQSNGLATGLARPNTNRSGRANARRQAFFQETLTEMLPTLQAVSHCRR